MISPRKTNIGVLSLGSSVATPKDGIEAEVLVVRSFDELEKPDISKQVRGKSFLMFHGMEMWKEFRNLVWLVLGFIGNKR